MQAADFSPDATGELVPLPRTLTPAELRDIEAGLPFSHAQVHAFVPHRLPPGLRYDETIVSALGRAMYALGQLDQAVRDLNNPYILVRPFLRREAVTSSRIEGTRTDISELVLYEAAGLPEDNRRQDAREVENYLKALEYALNQPAERPVSIGLIRELHQLLLEGVRGGHLEAGQLRTRQNFIGTEQDRIETARYVPPPPEVVRDLLLDLERFIDDESAIPSLIRIALIHYQFEAIHPFLDGNGRLGRLLIALLLRRWHLMEYPVIDLSAFVLQHRETYIGGLLRVSQQADWDGWVRFFLDAFETQATDAFRRGRRLIDLRQHYAGLLAGELRTATPDRLIDELFERLTITVRQAQDLLGVSFQTAQRFVRRLVEYGILEEAGERQRDRIYRARQIIAILDNKEP